MSEGGIMPMVPGEYLFDGAEIELNQGRPKIIVRVSNTGDRPIQVGSHTHFFEVNSALRFDRRQAYGCRASIPAGTAVRFEPGETREVELVAMGGLRSVYGMNALVMGPLDAKQEEAVRRAADGGYLSLGDA